jgi:hypothetical protein
MKKRYNDGGLPDYEREPDEQDRKQQEGAMAEYTDRKEKEAIMAKPLAKASFKEAFAEARAAGDKTFEWGGKKYTTEMASDKPKAKTASSSPVTPKQIGYKSSPRMSAEDRVKKERGMKSGGTVSASRRGDGCAIRGKTRGRMV